MKKFLVLLVSGLFMLGALGCSNGGDGGGEDTPTDTPTEEVEGPAGYGQ